MMKSYTAWCTSYEGEKMSMTRECESKKEFAQLLHDNGYKVSFIALTEKYDEESEKYHARLERKRRESAIRRECERQWRERDKKFAEELEKRLAEEEATEEPAQEAETMRFKKDYFAVNTKKIDKYNAIRFDSDIEFYVTNCTEAQEPEAIRKAVEKFVDELKKHGGAEILVDSLEMSLRFDEIGPECTFNEIRNGGNAFEIEINRGGDKDLFIYIRICEHQEAPKPETIKPFDELTEEEIENMIAEEVEKEYFGEPAAAVPNLYRNEPDNVPEVREMLRSCSHIQFDWRRNHAVFYKHEREIGRAVNVDNMDLQKMARSLGKSYDRTW